MFHSLIPLKNVQIFKRIVKRQTFLHLKSGYSWPLFNVQKNIFFLLTFFGHVLTILAWTKCRLVTKRVLSITNFHSCFFLLFHLIFIYTQNLSCPSKIIWYLFIRLCAMCMIIFLGITILSFHSHQICILSAGLEMEWNWDRLSCI